MGHAKASGYHQSVLELSDQKLGMMIVDAMHGSIPYASKRDLIEKKDMDAYTSCNEFGLDSMDVLDFSTEMERKMDYSIDLDGLFINDGIEARSVKAIHDYIKLQQDADSQ